VNSDPEVRFVARVEDELRRRRERELERCRHCGKPITRTGDWVRVRGGLMHTACPDTLAAVALPA
jgi:NMD protein affecting ribosome stability and mRNA decay